MVYTPNAPAVRSESLMLCPQSDGSVLRVRSPGDPVSRVPDARCPSGSARRLGQDWAADLEEAPLGSFAALPPTVLAHADLADNPPKHLVARMDFSRQSSPRSSRRDPGGGAPWSRGMRSILGIVKGEAGGVSGFGVASPAGGSCAGRGWGGCSAISRAAQSADPSDLFARGHFLAPQKAIVVGWALAALGPDSPRRVRLPA
jgi:hypothetical protein